MPAPEIIRHLVQQFAENRAEYRSPRYNEAQLRHEFLDKFFEALGWDMYNRKGYPLDTRDVIVEDSVEIEGHSKSPDYAFKIGKERKFYVEAKKPNVDIKFDYDPAFQLRRYAWNQHLALSVLTDFEEFSLYDCREKPAVGVSPATSRLMYVRYDEYIDRWDEITGILSKEAVYKGSFDRYVVETRGRKGTTEVDDEFLKDIEKWRKLLAQNIALRNPELFRAQPGQRVPGSLEPGPTRNERQLNFAVQMTIDRIIFLRICEDRGIEPTEQLLEMSKSPNIYQNLVALFTRADTKYNSGLFHFNHGKIESTSADTFTPTLLLDDRVLKEIIKGLYYPCPYIFKEIPVEILGQVYEQFLGKVIRLTPSHQAKVEEKPEVRKAGGVYYTPRYIVDYIVANTVGKLLEGKTPDDASALKIVDPACGSGSFLLGAFQYLMDWHEDWYINHDPEKWARGRNPALTLTKNGWQLTTAEKKRILVNNIHGVDIDAQAVEVTKLSLLLKVLEEETGQLSLGLERVLPDLGRNIQCGNSLIGWDYFEGQLVIDEVEKERVNPFDWRQAFPEVFRQGGFDAVIGNPPYINSNILEKTLSPEVKPYWKRKFTSASGAFDIYIIFIEMGMTILRKDGFLSFIVPNKFLAAEYAIEFRNWVFHEIKLESILDLSRAKVWPISVYPVVPVFRKDFPDKESQTIIRTSSSTQLALFGKEKTVKHSDMEKTPDKIWSFFTQPGFELLLKVINVSKPLEELADVYGASTVAEGSEYPKLIIDYDTESKNSAKFIVSGSVLRYSVTWGLLPVQFTHKKYQHPIILLKSPMPQRRIEQSKTPKIIICKVALQPRAYFDKKGEYVGAYTTYIFQKNVPLEYILGILNSKLIAFLYRTLYDALAMGGGYLRFQPPQIKRLPIFSLDSTNVETIKRSNQLKILVERMLELHKRTPQTPQEQESLAREIAATDGAIDHLVYELYGLTEDEIKIVEGG
jgi:hypothetical protein